MIAQAGTKANSVVERIDGASIKLRDGKIFTHDTHYDAFSCALTSGAFPEFSDLSEDSIEDFSEAVQSDVICERHGIDVGFVTTTGRFVDREEAHRIATNSNQIERDEYPPECDTLYAESLIQTYRSQ